MSERRRRRLIGWLLPRLLIFALGVALGYYVRDKQYRDLKEAYEDARARVESMRAAGADAIERGRRAGENLQSAADSTKAAVQEIIGEGN